MLIHPTESSLKNIQSQPTIAPLLFHHNLQQHIKVGSKSKYCIIGNFCSQTFMGINP